MDIASKSKYGKNTPSKTNNGNDQKSNDKDNEKKVSFNSSTKRSRISDDAPCPIHPGAGHKWSQCRSNAYNKDRQVKKAKPTTTNEAQSHAATAAGSKVEVHATTCDDPEDTLYSHGTFTPDSYFNDYSSFTLCAHHLDECFLVEQVLPDPEKYMSIMESFVMYNEDKFSTGDYNNVKDIVVNPMDPELLSPVSIMIARNIHQHESRLPLRVLFDLCSDITLINRRCLPKGCNPKTIPPIYVNTVHDKKPCTQEVLLNDVSLPEFSSSLKLPGPIRAVVFNNDTCSYDLIIGKDLILPLKIDISGPTQTVIWNNNAVPWHSREYFQANTYVQSLAASIEDDPLDEDNAKEAGYKSTKILHSKYETVDPEEVAQQQNHLTCTQKKQLEAFFSRYTKLF
jgi:hypothetical protein